MDMTLTSSINKTNGIFGTVNFQFLGTVLGWFLKRVSLEPCVQDSKSFTHLKKPTLNTLDFSHFWLVSLLALFIFKNPQIHCLQSAVSISHQEQLPRSWPVWLQSSKLPSNCPCGHHWSFMLLDHPNGGLASRLKHN